MPWQFPTRHPILYDIVDRKKDKEERGLPKTAFISKKKKKKS